MAAGDTIVPTEFLREHDLAAKVALLESTVVTPVTTLAGAGDVAISAPTDGQTLRYVAATNRWSNRNVLLNAVNVLDYGPVDLSGATDSSTALNAALATNRNVYVPPGTLLLNSTAQINYGQFIIGDRAVQEQGNTGPYTKLVCNVPGGVGIQFNGPLEGGGLANLNITKGGTTSYGIVMNDTANTLITDCTLWSFPVCGILMRTLLSAGSDSKRNTIQHTNVSVPDVQGAVGMHLAGTGSQDTYYNYFLNMGFSIVTAGVNAVRGIYIDLADGCWFQNTSFQITGSHTNVTPVVLDYTLASNQFPSDITFCNTDWDTGAYGSGTGITQVGTPSNSLLVTNKVIHNFHENGFPANPMLPNLEWEGVMPKAGAAVAADVPIGTYRVFHNTSNGATTMVYNNGGTLQTVALV